MDHDGYRFRQETVAGSDVIDELGHVSNLVYITWALDVAKAHSMAVGYDPEAYVKMGCAFVVRRHEVDYHRPVFEGERLELSTWVESWTSASSIRKTEIRKLDEAKTLVCALSTQWVFAALPSGRPKRIPIELRTAYDQYAG